jgi:hypothetical protein
MRKTTPRVVQQVLLEKFMTTAISLLIGFTVNLLIAFIIVRFIYYPSKQNKNYVFTFIAFNTIIFFVMSLLTSIEIGVGAGFGMFAIFSVLRYRTNPMPPREMTYLFIMIALPVANSVLMGNGNWDQVLVGNGLIVGVIYILEQGWGFHYERSQTIVFDDLELVKPENYDRLLGNLRQRTGLPVKRWELGRLNFVKDTAEIKIYYDDTKRNGWWENAGIFDQTTHEITPQ